MRVLLISTDCSSNDYRVIHNAVGGVSYYRLTAPQKAVNSLGHEWDYFGNKQDNNFNNSLKGYDLVISKHIDNPHSAKNLKVACQKNKIPLVFDLDDDLFSVRTDNPAYDAGYKQGEMKRAYMATNLSFADAFFVSTEPLKDSYHNTYKDIFDIDIPTFVLPNYIDPDLWQFDSKVNCHNPVIGYHGSVTHDSDLKIVLPVIDKLMDKHKKLRMELVGSVRKESIEKLFDGIKNKKRFRIIKGTPAYDSFPQFIMSMKWDIGIAPLIDDAFNRGKSHIKYMEYSMKKIPTVASDVYPYTNNAPGALLCSTTDDWYETLDRLLKNPTERTTVGERAYQQVMFDYNYKDKGDKWIKACETVINNYKK